MILFLHKAQIIYIFCFADHIVSVATTKYVNEQGGCAPITFHLQKQAVGQRSPWAVVG